MTPSQTEKLEKIRKKNTTDFSILIIFWRNFFTKNHGYVPLGHKNTEYIQIYPT